VYKKTFKNTLLGYLPISLINSLYRMRYMSRCNSWLDAPFFLIHIPKCVGMSVCAATRLPDPGHIEMTKMPKTLVRSLIEKPCLAIIRDPVDRIVSTFDYAHKLRRKGITNTVDFIADFSNINDFVSTLLMRKRILRHYFLLPANDFIRPAQMVGAEISFVDFKKLDEECVSFLTAQGYSIKELPMINQSNKQSSLLTHISELSDKSKGVITELYAEDVELYESIKK